MNNNQRRVIELRRRPSGGLQRSANVAILLTVHMALCLVFVASHSRAHAATQEELIESILKKWEGQRSEIYTASIHFRTCSSFNDLKPLKFEDVAALVASADLLRDPDALNRLISQTSAKPLPQAPKWLEVGFKMSGHNLREDINGGIQIATEDTKLELDNANRAVQLFTPGRSQRHQTSLSDLRFIPVSNPKMSLQSVKGRKAILQAGEAEYHVDTETAAVEKASFRGGDGNIIDCRWQGDFVSSPSGIIFPKWRIRARFNSHAELWYLAMTIIDQTVLNEPIPDADFHAEAPAGIKVLDNRVPGQEGTFRLNRDVADVAAAVADPSVHSAFPGQSSPSGRFKYTHLVVLNAGLVLVFLGYSLIRHRSKRHGR